MDVDRNTHYSLVEGLLTPCHQEFRGQVYKFKLSTESDEYFLLLNQPLTAVAKRAAWEEVIVKGHRITANRVIKVDRLILAPTRDPALDDLAS